VRFITHPSFPRISVWSLLSLSNLFQCVIIITQLFFKVMGIDLRSIPAPPPKYPLGRRFWTAFKFVSFAYLKRPGHNITALLLIRNCQIHIMRLVTWLSICSLREIISTVSVKQQDARAHWKEFDSAPSTLSPYNNCNFIQIAAYAGQMNIL
jgi:hypothetical protein